MTTLGGVNIKNNYVPLDTVTSSELLTSNAHRSSQQRSSDMAYAKNSFQEPQLLSAQSNATHQVENIAPNMHIVEERSHEASQDFH